MYTVFRGRKGQTQKVTSLGFYLYSILEMAGLQRWGTDLWLAGVWAGGFQGDRCRAGLRELYLRCGLHRPTHVTNGRDSTTHCARVNFLVSILNYIYIYSCITCNQGENWVKGAQHSTISATSCELIIISK